jgi:hypothetical protein
VADNFIPLTGGAYQAKSVIANAQRSVNLYPERNGEEDEPPAPVTHYPTPGLTLLVQGDTDPVRGLYFASNNELFAVIGAKVYYVDQNWTLTLLGTMTTSDGTPYTRQTPVSMKDNGTTILLVDGSSQGYTIALATHAFAIYVDASGGLFQNVDRVDYLDTFLFMNCGGTRRWISTTAATTVIDPTYFAEKVGAPDLLETLIAVHHEIILVGQLTSEVWFDEGGAAFPFAEQPGTFIEHGTCAKYSVAKSDISAYWLGRDEQGRGIVFKTQAYKALRISTHAIEQILQGKTLTDAIGYTYQLNGHVFYVLTLPSADITLVYDEATQLWHQWACLGDDGALHRHRSNCFAPAYGGALVVGDYANGKLYKLDPDVYTDAGQPIPRIRSFPTLRNAGKRVTYNRFQADMETGTLPNNYPNNEFVYSNPDGEVSLRWSDDFGKTWGQPLTQNIGPTGAFNTILLWTRLGTGRNRVFELSWSGAFKTALNGAFVSSDVAET